MHSFLDGWSALLSVIIHKPLHCLHVIYQWFVSNSKVFYYSFFISWNVLLLCRIKVCAPNVVVKIGWNRWKCSMPQWALKTVIWELWGECRKCICSNNKFWTHNCRWLIMTRVLGICSTRATVLSNSWYYTYMIYIIVILWNNCMRSNSKHESEKGIQFSYLTYKKFFPSEVFCHWSTEKLVLLKNCLP